MLYQLSYAGAQLILGGTGFPSRPVPMIAQMAQGRSVKRRDQNEVEFSRIVAFSDGVFAIAITLLVLNLDIPGDLGRGELADALWAEREPLLAFAISFAVVGRFWIVHHRFFGAVTGFDERLIALNLVYLAFIVLIPFSSQVLGEYVDETAGVVTYSVNLAAVVLVGLAMAGFADRAGLTSAPARERRLDRVRAGYIAAVFLLSIPLAFFDPGIAPLFWVALFFDPARWLARRRATARR